MGAWSIWHWLVVLAVVLLVFGTKKLRNMGEDLGGAVRGFKAGLKSGEDTPANSPAEAEADAKKEGRIIDAEPLDQAKK